jgi:predicted protein tyrosine phosphatase
VIPTPLPIDNGSVIMKFIVASRGEIERGIIVRHPYIVISISDPGTPPPRVRRPPAFRDVLHLQFHDEEPVEGFKSPRDIVLMSEEQAREIREFVDRYRDDVGAIVVHCEQGASRSPAVAAALAKALGEDGDRFFFEYVPNQYVYNLVLAAASERPDGQLR